MFAHSTENPDKILAAAKNLLPPNIIGKTNFVQFEMYGHHRNPVTLFKAETNFRNGIEVLQSLFSRLTTIDEELLSKDLHKYIDSKGFLYLRFDKQQAYLGRVILGSSDAISLKVKLGFHPSSLVDLKSTLEKMVI